MIKTVHYGHGIVVGRFHSLTQGHLLLIDSALSFCDKVTVLLCSSKLDSIPGLFRKDWLKSIYFELERNGRLEIIWSDKESIQIKDYFWETWIDEISEIHKNVKIDVVFSGNDNIESLAIGLSAQFHIFDRERKYIPIDSEKVLSDPFKYWEYIPVNIRGNFVHKIAIVGPESTGKSTLTKQLKRIFKTEAVEEYGRIYWQNLRRESREPTTDDFTNIVKAHYGIEQSTRQFANKILLSDTEAITTQTFHMLLMNGIRSQAIDEFISEYSDHELFLVLKPDNEYFQDGEREVGENNRVRHFEIIVRELNLWGVEYQIIRGDNKLEQAIAILKSYYPSL